MLTQEPAVEATDAALPAWARPAGSSGGSGRKDQDETGRASVVKGVLVRVVGAGGVASVLLLLGHTVGAILLLTVLGMSSVLSLTVPAVGRGIDRFIAGFQTAVGKALTFVLLGLVHLVVFVPVSLILKLLRQDPLALGATAEDTTFWRGAARRPHGRPLYKRPFAYERHPVVAGRRRIGLLQVLGALMVVGLVDLGIGRLMGVEDGAATREPPRADEFQIPHMDAVAADDEEAWAGQLFDELSENYRGMRYHPWRSLQMSDTDGEYVNVTDGVRRSYEPQLSGGGAEPIEVYFLGGSAMMGWFQRDEHTIASEFARLAEADGIDVRVVNRGTPAYDNWQEQLLLEELVTAGETPELAVFYDGMNEIGAQFRSPGEDGMPTHMHASDVAAELAAASETASGSASGSSNSSGDAASGGSGNNNASDSDSAWSRMTDAYSSQSAIGEIVRRVRGEGENGSSRQPAGDNSTGDDSTDDDSTFFVPWPAQLDDPAAAGTTAADLHGRGVEAAEALADHYGFRTAFFWQPSVYSKPAVDGEEAAIGSWGTDPASWEAAAETARANLHDGVVDLSDVFDDVDEPVMYDYVHTNERGARILAQAIYDQLKPTLLELSQ